MVVLYHPNGRSLELDQELWRKALECARGQGWRATGTLAPPQTLGERGVERWDGGYEQPLGQEVVREDARRFGMALGLADRREFDRLREFSLEAGFIVCDVNPTRAPGAGLAQLGRYVGWRREAGKGATAKRRPGSED